MLNLGTDLSSLEALDQEWDIPCEMEHHGDRGFTGAAEYVMWFSCCPSPRTGAFILACRECKDFKLAYPVITCPTRDGGCGAVFTPGSKAYRLIEPLNKAAA